mgnify:CR=1 FL=1
MDAPLPPLLDLLKTQARSRWAEEARSDWAYVAFYRPLATTLAWILAHGPTTPMAVTLAGGVSIPLMIAAALWLPAGIAVPVVGLLGWLGGLLDCVDGDLARLTGRTSWLGRYVDFQIDVARWATLFVAVGHAADRAAGGGATWLAVAGLAAWLRLFARAARDYRFGTLGREPPSEPKPFRWTPASLAETFVSGLDGLLPIALGLGWLAGLGGWVLLLPLAMALADTIRTQWDNIARYRRA